MFVREGLRLESAVIAATVIAAYFWLEGPLWLFAVLVLAPDLGMLGYLAGERVGAATYNAVHTYAPAVVLGGYGLWRGPELAVLVALVWAAHVAIDRTAGFSLKYPSGFRDTHLDRV